MGPQKERIEHYHLHQLSVGPGVLQSTAAPPASQLYQGGPFAELVQIKALKTQQYPPLLPLTCQVCKIVGCHHTVLLHMQPFARLG